MPASKAHPILISTSLLVALPALAQQAAVEGDSVQTIATTRIDQPATLTSSRDLAFVLQAPVAAALSIGQGAASPAIVAPPVAAPPSTAAGGSAARVAGSGAAAGPDAGSLVRGAASTVSAAVPTVAQATFTVAGDGGQAISVTVPPTVDLARDGGGETALLTTTSNLASGPQFLGGNFADGGTLSFAVGGQVTLASSTAGSSGTYNGVLAVIAQYN